MFDLVMFLLYSKDGCEEEKEDNALILDQVQKITFTINSSLFVIKGVDLSRHQKESSSLCAACLRQIPCLKTKHAMQIVTALPFHSDFLRMKII